jgi:hypothetical protein
LLRRWRARSAPCALAAALAVTLLAGAARAKDIGEVTLRGNYYRDRNTRVVQPAVDLITEAPNGTVVGAHYLLDAITSASVAAGVLRDQPFTELRNEAGLTIGQRLGPVLFSGAYSYSSESDYWAHTAGLRVVIDLFQRNTQLDASLGYGNDRVALRMGPTLYNPLGGLQTVRGLLNLTQLLTPTLIGTLSYEIGVLGFGTPQNGWQSNPYRAVNVGGAPAREVVPYQRIRQSVSGTLRWLIPTHIHLMPYLVFRPSYRFYFDDWGITSHTPELRMYVPAGPTEFRVSARYYTQSQASFWNDVDGVPSYPMGVGLHCTTCFSESIRQGLYYTSDPKLSSFTTEFLELRFLVNLRDLARVHIPGALWLSSGIVEISYGHYFNGGYAHRAFGDAEIAGMTLSWPL